MKWRVSGLNLLLAALTASTAVVLVVFFPGIPALIQVLAVLGAAAMFATLMLVVRYARTRDFNRLPMFAAVRGWKFWHVEDSLADRFAVLPKSVGTRGSVINVMRGPHRFHECVTFTYVVTKPAPQFFQVTFVELGVKPPRLEMLPEDALAAVAKLVGGQDLKVGDPEIDSRWRVVAEDEGFARAVLNPELRARLRAADVRGMPIAIDGGAVLTWRAGSEGTRGLSRSLNVLISVARAIPDEVWTSRR